MKAKKPKHGIAILLQAAMSYAEQEEVTALH
jgi:hypothetical protein